MNFNIICASFCAASAQAAIDECLSDGTCGMNLLQMDLDRPPRAHDLVLAEEHQSKLSRPVLAAPNHSQLLHPQVLAAPNHSQLPLHQVLAAGAGNHSQLPHPQVLATANHSQLSHPQVLATANHSQLLDFGAHDAALAVDGHNESQPQFGSKHQSLIDAFHWYFVSMPAAATPKHFPIPTHQDYYWRSVLMSGPAVLLGCAIPLAFPDDTGVSHALASVFLWGVKGYLIALSSHFGQLYPKEVIVGIDYLAWVWAFIIVSMVCFHVYFKVTDDGYAQEQAQVRSLSGRTVVAYIVAGVTACAGEAFLQMGFGEDTEASGPHYAISTAYSLIVTPFFWFYANEKLSTGQLMGLTCVVGGTFIMGAQSVVAVVVAFLALVWWSIDAIAYRLAGIWGSPPCTGVMMRLGIMWLCGVVAVFYIHVIKGTPLPAMQMMVVPLYNSVCDALSICSLIRAFEAPRCKAGIVTGVLPLQTLVMSALNLFIMGWQPGLTECIGGAVVIAGCSAMCLAPTEMPAIERKEEASW